MCLVFMSEFSHFTQNQTHHFPIGQTTNAIIYLYNLIYPQPLNIGADAELIADTRDVRRVSHHTRATFHETVGVGQHQFAASIRTDRPHLCVRPRSKYI